MLRNSASEVGGYGSQDRHIMIIAAVKDEALSASIGLFALSVVGRNDGMVRLCKYKQDMERRTLCNGLRKVPQALRLSAVTRANYAINQSMTNLGL